MRQRSNVTWLMSPCVTLMVMPFQPPPEAMVQSRNVRSWQGWSSVSTAVVALPPTNVHRS